MQNPPNSKLGETQQPLPSLSVQSGQQQTQIPDLSDARFAWRRASVPGLDSFLPLLQASVFGSPEKAPKMLAVLRSFEVALQREYLPSEILRLSEPTRVLQPQVFERPLRFYFTPALMRGGQILLTVFLQATPEELAARPHNFSNANKHLHNGFLTENGIFRKSPAEFEREGLFARRYEHTAYAKFYMTSWSGKPFDGISLLVHPLQNARLGYRADLDFGHDTFRQRLHLAELALQRLIVTIERGRFPESPYATNPERLEFLKALKADIHNLFSLGSKSSFVTAAERTIKIRQEQLGAGGHNEQDLRWLTECVRDIRVLHYRSHEDPLIAEARARGRHQVVSLRKDIHRLLNDVQHVVMVRKRAEEGHEAYYHSASAHTGVGRAQIMLGLSDILRSYIRENMDLETFRFMLASEQIEKIRLKNPRGRVRESVVATSQRLEEFYPTIKTSYPLFAVDERGVVADATTPQPVTVISFDGGGFANGDFQLKRSPPG